MFAKPPVIALALTLLSAIPLYLFSSQEYSLTLGNLPLFLLSLFVLLLLASVLGNRADRASGRDKRDKRDDSETDEYDDDYADRETGNVKWFNPSKGFGFITRESGEDVFVHFRSIRGKGHRVLRDGQKVEFAVSEGKKGLQADDVAVAG